MDMESDEALRPLAQAIQAATSGVLLVVTGAGVSLASGISTFRGTDPGAVWSRDVTELGTHRFFREDPAGSWRWYLARFEKVVGARPNAAHHALASLERWQLARGGRFLLVTQNIDGLHRAAGSQELVEVHGRADRVRCSSKGCALGAPTGSIPRDHVDIAPFLAEPAAATVPRCPACGSLLRQHILWFDEYYTEHEDYQFERAIKAAGEAAVVLFVGTSFSVTITSLVVQDALDKGASLYSIDPAGDPPVREVHPIRARAEDALAGLCRQLGASPSD
jgi:NAD-dependent deacetylase